MIKPEKRAQVLAAIKAELTLVKPEKEFSFGRIAKEVGGVSKSTVRAIAKKAGIKTPLQGLTPGERMKLRHKNSAFAATVRETSRKSMVRLNADPAFTAASAERIKKLNADPAFVARKAPANSANLKKLNADPEFVKKRLNGLRRSKLSKRLKKSTPSPEGNG